MRYFILCLFFFSTCHLQAQKLVEKGNCYIYEGIKYCSDEEVEQLFSLNNDAIYWYTESVSSNDKASNLGVLSIAGLAASYFILKGVNGSNTLDPEYGKLTLGLGVGLVACGLGVVGIAVVGIMALWYSY